MPSSPRMDPYLGLNFLVEIDGLLCGGFSQVRGLEGTIEVEDRRQGGVNDHLDKVVTGASWSNLVLTRGVTDSDALWSWYEQTRRGAIQRKSGTILLLDAARNPAISWTFRGALPVKWSGPSFDAAQDSQVAIETVELIHLGLVRASAGAR